MSFDPRSLQRLQELGRQLPQPLPDPEPKAKTKAKRPLHKVETEEEPEALFRELMAASADGTVPEHLLHRLKELEKRRAPQQANPLAQPIQSEQLPPPPNGGRTGKGKTTRPKRPRVSPGSEEESLYVAFGQLLLEDDEDER